MGTSFGFKEAETIMKPAENSGDTHRDIIRKKLPNGVELRILESGVENQLLAFLEQASPDSGEFNLDRISFDRAKSTLQSSLQEQLQNLAKILKAYPNTREFSRSSKKYVQFRILSTTRPRAGALTYWDLVKCFDHKAAERTGRMKQLAARKKRSPNSKLKLSAPESC